MMVVLHHIRILNTQSITKVKLFVNLIFIKITAELTRPKRLIDEGWTKTGFKTKDKFHMENRAAWGRC
jgi:hypothetical protein